MTMFDLDSLTLVPARWQIVPSSPRTIDIIGIHSAEAAELPSTAEALGAYFNRHQQILDGTRKASTHLGVDVDSVGFYVPFENIAYAAGGINQNGIHIEHAGYARQTRAEWLDEYSLPMLRLSASLTAALCVRYDIPAVWLSPADLLAKQRGITSHHNACIAFGGDHWDPGYEFPEDLYIEWVREAIGDDMALSDDDVHRVAEAVVSRVLDIEGTSAPLAEWIGYLYAQVTRPEFLTKRVAEAVVAQLDGDTNPDGP